MTISLDVHGFEAARVEHYPHHSPRPFTTLDITFDDVGRVSLYFGGIDDTHAWLQDALDKVQLAKAELANTQPAPVHAERESNEVHGCYAGGPEGLSCVLDRGHTGAHEARGPHTDEQPDGELVGSWDEARIGQPIDLADVAVPL